MSDDKQITDLNTVAISEFKARCLNMLDQVRRTGAPFVVTRRGEPVAMIVPPPPPSITPSWLGSKSGTAHIKGDIISPVVPAEEWEVLS